jgi:hypothetical protein
MSGVKEAPLKKRYLVVYDYGKGGVWAYVEADSAREIQKKFPELTVVQEPPSWMTEEYRNRLLARTYDIDESNFGLLADLIDQRGKSSNP